ncbi:hypothetical protein SDC9_108356 [bioreactor metagenome]|uniref:CAAX prenyl protease 2/Lysostaphin resistance protein A-like domain-containing protein n=1 Tax=bioreactor metagenome TaxID=1076179 RepID=A0A645B8W2_9ZZZZ|nr:CPBP family intramembrane glutamic endopeptidase [Romboutsia lituseburensis]
MKRIFKSLGLGFGLLVLHCLIGSITVDIFTKIFKLHLQQDENVLVTLGSYSTLAILYYISLNKNKLVNEYNFKKICIKDIIYIILLGIGIDSISTIIINSLINIFPGYIEVTNKMDASTNSIISIICFVVFIPIFEEIMCRGIIFNHLKRNYSIVSAIIIQALIFGLLHGNIIQSTYTFICGIVFVLVNIYCGSIFGGIILHIIFNLFGVLYLKNLLTFNEFYSTIYLSLGVLIFAYIGFKMILNYKKHNIKNKYSKV